MEVRCVLTTIKPEHLTSDDRELLEIAHAAAALAYAPYSGFKVGSAVRLSNGVIVKGSNQENIAYPSGLCGERVAVMSAGAQYPGVEIVSMATVSPSSISISSTFLPCGACRQVLLESESRQSTPIRLLFQARDEEIIVSDSAANLMPFSFEVKDDGLTRNSS
jgi:cytidine deaminase